MEVIGNALELRAFDRMEEDIRLIGYFKNEDSERECVIYLALTLLSILECVCCTCDGLSVALALNYNMSAF